MNRFIDRIVFILSLHIYFKIITNGNIKYIYAVKLLFIDSMILVLPDFI